MWIQGLLRLQNVHFGLLDFHGECLQRGFGGAAFGQHLVGVALMIQRAKLDSDAKGSPFFLSKQSVLHLNFLG